MGKINIWALPDKVYIVPSFDTPGYESPLEYIHIRNEKCPLSKCKEKKSKLHSLEKKEQPLCLHTVLIHSIAQASLTASSSSKKTPMPKLNRELSTKIVMDKILEHFPSMTKMESTGFVRKSRRYVEKLVTNENRNETVMKQTIKCCTSCPETLLEDWPFKPKQAFLFSLGHLVKIEIPLKFCRSCKRVFYPGNFLLVYTHVSTQPQGVILSVKKNHHPNNTTPPPTGTDYIFFA